MPSLLATFILMQVLTAGIACADQPIATQQQPATGYCFEEAGKAYKIAPVLLWTIAQHESAMNPTAINWNLNETGHRLSFDYGVMQINSSWAKALGPNRWAMLGDPCTNIMTGAWILRQCMDKYGENWIAVGCYNSSTPAKRDRYARMIASKLTRLTLLADRSRN